MVEGNSSMLKVGIAAGVAGATAALAGMALWRLFSNGKSGSSATEGA